MGLTAFVIQGLIKLDDKDFKKSLSDAENSAKGWGEKLSGVGEKMKHGMAVAGKAAAAAVGAASVAIGKLTLDAVNAYSEYEQLTGGVETLFGTSAKNLKEYFDQVGIDSKSSAKEVSAAMDKYNSLVAAEEKVIKDAHEAYITAGMDANTYMQTVTSFSASLLQSLNGDTVAAAEASRQAVIDMSDNANKMGTDMQSIQNAYQGFAKQNYTMLDNLKLGYGGAKQEMQRLLKDAEKIMKQQGKNVKYSINNLADVYEAIHVVQTEMGITGTTAEEAEKTIQGSTNMMKAAWMNLKIAMVSPNGNIGQAIKDMTESIKVAARNWIPAIKQALSGIGEVIKELAPVLAAELPGLISELLPGIIEGAVTLITALAQGIIDNVGILIDAFIQIVGGIADALKNSDSPLLQTIGGLLEGIMSVLSWINEHGEEVMTAITLIGGAWAAWQLGSILMNLNPIVMLVTALAGLATLIVTNWEDIKGFFEGIWSAVQTAVTDAYAAVEKWWKGVKENISAAWTVIAQWFDDTVWKPLTRFFTAAWDTIKQLWEGTKEAIANAWTTIADWFNTTVWTPLTTFFTTAWDTIKQLWDGTKEAIANAWTTIADWFNTTVWTPLSTFFSTAWSVVTQLWDGILTTVQNAWKDVSWWIRDNVTSKIGEAFNRAEEAVRKVWNAIKKIFDMEHLKEFVIQVSVNFVGDAAKWLLNNMGTGLSEATNNNLVDIVLSLLNGGGGEDGSNAKGNWNVPYDGFRATLHRDEMVLTASQARRYREGESEGYDLGALTEAVAAGIQMGMANAQVNSYIDGKEVTDVVSRILGNNLSARRFA